MSRAPIDMMLDGLTWRALPAQEPLDDLPVATHEGVLEIAGARLRCFQLSDGQRVFDAGDVERFFGVSEGDVK